MGKQDMTSSYRIAQELFKDRLRKQSPETLELLDDIHAADVIVVRGSYDLIEQVLDSADTPYTLVQPELLGKAKLRPDQVVFINCPGNLNKKSLRKLESFVRKGGFLFTTDWALRHVIEQAFPGFLAYNERRTGDEVVRIEILDQDDTILRSVLDEQDDPQWWLEGSSYPIKVLDPKRVKVLIQSKELKERHGEAPVFVSFEYGEGQVYHMISHFYLQRSETRTARHAAPSTDYLASKGVAAADMGKFKDLGSDEFPTSDIESAYTSYAMIKTVVLKKKKQSKK
ncbi:MAG: hypothetical protein ACE5M4_00960 [Anaerolineales bacterium]